MAEDGDVVEEEAKIGAGVEVMAIIKADMEIIKLDLGTIKVVIETIKVQ